MRKNKTFCLKYEYLESIHYIQYSSTHTCGSSGCVARYDKWKQREGGVYQTSDAEQRVECDNPLVAVEKSKKD